ncbi:hypothetical protein, partial [Actinocorallia lasiicapitis]
MQNSRGSTSGEAVESEEFLDATIQGVVADLRAAAEGDGPVGPPAARTVPDGPRVVVRSQEWRGGREGYAAQWRDALVAAVGWQTLLTSIGALAEAAGAGAAAKFRVTSVVARRLIELLAAEGAADDEEEVRFTYPLFAGYDGLGVDLEARQVYGAVIGLRVGGRPGGLDAVAPAVLTIRTLLLDARRGGAPGIVVEGDGRERGS